MLFKKVCFLFFITTWLFLTTGLLESAFGRMDESDIRIVSGRSDPLQKMALTIRKVLVYPIMDSMGIAPFLCGFLATGFMLYRDKPETKSDLQWQFDELIPEKDENKETFLD